jgi:hypothetical protein
MDNRMRHTLPSMRHRINKRQPLLPAFIWFLLNNCMNNYTAERKEKKWLADNGINHKTFVNDPLHLVQAQQIAHNILKHHGQLLAQNEVHTLNQFLIQARGKQSKQRITVRQAQTVMNIGASVNRKVFKKIRQQKRRNRIGTRK